MNPKHTPTQSRTYAEAKALKRYIAAKRACAMARDLATHLEARETAALLACLKLRGPKAAAALRVEGRA